MRKKSKVKTSKTKTTKVKNELKPLTRTQAIELISSLRGNKTYKEIESYLKENNYVNTQNKPYALGTINQYGNKKNILSKKSKTKVVEAFQASTNKESKLLNKVFNVPSNYLSSDDKIAIAKQLTN